MKIYPALDIRDGKCVRLIKGNYNNEIIFNDDPVQVAEKFEMDGSKFIHIIDLDGAKFGDTTIKDIIEKIINKTNLNIQIGGGIRTFEKAESYINLGVKKIIFGTAALDNREEVLKSIDNFPSKVTVSIDALNGHIKTKGWIENSEINIEDMVMELEQEGCRSFIYTDIEKDGTLSHPNFQYISKFRKFCSSELNIAGGISSIEDLVTLKKLGVDGAILGMSLYKKNIDLKKALNKI
jgi:phosphoribosylformimino-5-aminoimidazole carboxamide ribotide isomerase|tara:strand:- start:22830 stop:23540 length:711 start_codon:yes stop_codon:yes gene_type:complete